ncbi:MAG: hypothetical protein COB36_14810 [Alphaproteobacteria bacterium]|nr:MAG: hypothetical protein COB36_14810 [Alphaproteobacteria bacterium]
MLTKAGIVRRLAAFVEVYAEGEGVQPTDQSDIEMAFDDGLATLAADKTVTYNPEALPDYTGKWLTWYLSYDAAKRVNHENPEKFKETSMQGLKKIRWIEHPTIDEIYSDTDCFRYM